MLKQYCEEALDKMEQYTWNLWHDHCTACYACRHANLDRSVLSRGCTRGRVVFLDWHSASARYIAALDLTSAGYSRAPGYSDPDGLDDEGNSISV